MSASDRPTLNKKLKATPKLKSTYVSEADVEASAVKFLDALAGCCQFKMGVNGWPDRVVCYKGFFIGFEFKSSDPGKKATVMQQRRLVQIRAAGGLGIIARSVEDVREVIQRVDDTVADMAGGKPTGSTAYRRGEAPGSTQAPVARRRSQEGARGVETVASGVESPIRKKAKPRPKRKTSRGQLRLIQEG
jgi:hypothetical protein